MEVPIDPTTSPTTYKDFLNHVLSKLGLANPKAPMERLEAVTANRMQPPLVNNTEHRSEVPELDNHGQPTWPGPWPKYPAV